MANMLGFLAARHARAPWPVRREGMTQHRRLHVYASRGTHAWLVRAADVAGLGTESIRWVATDRHHRLDARGLEQQIAADSAEGATPFLVVGTAGNVSTGAIDPLPEMAEIAARTGLWFHVDGAYGAPAAMLDDAPPELAGVSLADSLALDPHKWLYNPIEAACVLVRDPDALSKAFSYKPSYYRREKTAEEAGADYYEHGLQNSRGFRALKTWLCLQAAGRDDYANRIRADISLARVLFELAEAEPELEAGTLHLSIATFRYLPRVSPGEDPVAYRDAVNARIVEWLIDSGNSVVSNAVLDGQHYLRACIVNFRTTEADVRALVRDVLQAGREITAGPAGN